MYQPSDETLKKYADLLVKFALNSGKGVQPDEVVQLNIPDVAKPLYLELMRAVLESGAFPKLTFIPTETDKVFFKYASDKQLKFFPEKFKRAEADLIDHSISIIAETDPRELKDVEPGRLFQAMDSRRKFRDWLFTKEQQGKYTWTLGLYGTEAMAAEAGMSIDDYWSQIKQACYLDSDDPIQEWKKIQKEQDRVKESLDTLKIETLEIKGKNIDLVISLGKERKWMGGNCRNIPSFELFISPDWRGTEGSISFNQPVYRYGNILRGVRLVFEKGTVKTAEASEVQKVLDGMLTRENARKIGEFSLTDKRFSRITKFMANTLYDENIGGEFGNMHLALGRAYKDSYPGDPSKPSKEQWEAWGYNDSPEHTDIVTTEDRTVTASLPDGSKKVIFEKGMFTV